MPTGMAFDGTAGLGVVEGGRAKKLRADMGQDLVDIGLLSIDDDLVLYYSVF